MADDITAPASPGPDAVRDLATACVASVRATLAFDLDFTPDTLAVLDHYAKEVVQEEDATILQLVAPMCGAYFGEVVRRELGAARWHAPDDTYRLWRLELEPAFLHFNPLGVALEVLRGEDAPGWYAHLQFLDDDRSLVASTTENLGAVKAEDYYRFTVRHEVVQGVAANLAEKPRLPGQPVYFGPEVYAAAAEQSQESRTN
ncbi:MAG: hypothetical protein AAF447_26065 [Myxococcota bacterium]